MPSDSTMMSRIFSIASGFSILAIIFVLLFFSCSLLRRIIRSFTLRTKERATQSNCCSIINSRSTKSFSVKAGNVIFVSGRLIPFFDERMPPRITLTTTSLFFSIPVTFTSSLPSSIMMMLPIFTSLCRLG